jgi:GTP cyclohydrolase I
MSDIQQPLQHLQPLPTVDSVPRAAREFDTAYTVAPDHSRLIAATKPLATGYEPSFGPTQMAEFEGMLIAHAGLNTQDEHGRETAARFIRAIEELTACKNSDDEHLSSCIKWKDFPANGMRDMIVLQRIPFTSLCNHHMLPFTGWAHIAYVPEDYIAGLSKFARVVQHFARKLQVQERLTSEIADFLEANLKPKGVGVVLRAEHMCMALRGAEVAGVLTTTSTMRGVFGEHDRTAKAEFMAFVNGNGH